LGTTFSLPPTFIRPAGKAGKWRGAAFEWLKTFCGPRPQLEWKMTENLGGGQWWGKSPSNDPDVDSICSNLAAFFATSTQLISDRSRKVTKKSECD